MNNKSKESKYVYVDYYEIFDDAFREARTRKK